MEEYLAEQAAKPGPTMTITKAAYVFLLEQLRAAEAAQGAAPRAEGLDVERLRAALKSSAEKREWSTEPYAFDQLAEFIAEEYENG